MPSRPIRPIGRIGPIGLIDGASPRFLGALLVLALVACAPHGGPPGAKNPFAMGPVPVRVATVARKAEPLQARAVGQVATLQDVAVIPQVDGRLLAAHFREGGEVARGQLLFTIDPRPYQAALAQAQANLARDRAQAAQSRRDAARYAAIVGKGYVTEQQAAQAKATAEAQAATVAADRAAVQTALLNLSYCQIRSPISGKTGLLGVKVGNVVKANQATPLITINQLKPIGVTFSLPSKELPSIQANFGNGPLATQAVVPGATTSAFGGLSFIDNTVNTQTGTITLRATFPNADELLWPGEPVDVVLTVAVQKDAVVVPSSAVQEGQQGTYAFVVKPDKTVEERAISIARTVGEDSIVQTGLAPGDVVVTDGALALVNGSHVQILGGETPVAPIPDGGTEVH